MSNNLPEEPFFLDEDDLQDYEEYKRSHGMGNPGTGKGTGPKRVKEPSRPAGEDASARAAAAKLQPRQESRERKEEPSKGPVRQRTAKQGRKVRRRKRTHPVRNFFLVLILVLVLGMGAIAVMFLPDSYAIDPSFNSGASQSLSSMAWTTIALFGVDSREQNLVEGDNRSDAILICAVHRLTGRIRLVSLYRDTFLDVGGGTYTKANAAYAYGGPEQAVTMLNTNLDLHIHDFVTIGFEGLADTIDALGGVDLELTAEEAGNLNQYVEDMYWEIGTSDDPVSVEDGVQHLTGIQAVAYCRIRYTAGDDYRRTERQRTVMKAVLSQARHAGPGKLLKAARTLSEGTATSLNKAEMLLLLVKAPFYSLDETSGLPAAELRTADMIQGQSCVIPLTLSENARWLHETLYGEKGYEVSPALQERSSYIQSVY